MDRRTFLVSLPALATALRALPADASSRFVEPSSRTVEVLMVQNAGPYEPGVTGLRKMVTRHYWTTPEEGLDAVQRTFDLFEATFGCECHIESTCHYLGRQSFDLTLVEGPRLGRVMTAFKDARRG